MADPLDLQQFCSRRDLRTYLNQPWTHRGFRCASNGHILVCVPDQASADEMAAHPLAEKIPDILAKAGKAHYIPLPPFPQPKPCKSCGGSGTTLQSACGDCDGEGEFDHGNHTYSCQECDGDGWLSAVPGQTGAQEQDCPECRGAGYYRQSAPVGDAGYDVVYLRLLAQLPNLRICTNGQAHGAHFVFDGGEGMLMPRRAD